ncbi:MAG TPA: flagellar hook-associated protein FlgK [Gemmatimonadales bacterium]|jgi:flagellar hook-associated protein 1 FlgK
MSGLTDVLNIAKTALLTQQRAMTVTGNNIANANTPGYVRETLNELEETPERTPKGTVGRGVMDTGVYAERDTFLDASYRNENSAYNQSNTLQNLLDQLQSVTSQDQNSGLANSLDTLWGSFSDLANDPSNGAAKVTVQADANQVIQQLHSLQSGLDDVVSSAKQQFSSDVDEVNSLTSQIAALNTQIVAQGGPNHQAPDLENQRGVLIDQLSNLVDVRTLNRTDGSVGVIAGGTLLVDAGTAQQVDMRTSPSGGLSVGVVGSPASMTISSGSLAGLNDLLTDAAPAAQSALDTFTSALVTSVNAIHSTGPAGINFFDPSGTTARSIALSSQVAASAANIQTGTTTSPGDNTIALQLSQLRDASNASLGGNTLDQYFAGVVTDIGTRAANAQTAATAANTVSSALSQQRQSETGVNTDEELIKLMQQQQAYSAAAHLVTVANQMMQSLLDMV